MRELRISTSKLGADPPQPFIFFPSFRVSSFVLMDEVWPSVLFEGDFFSLAGRPVLSTDDGLRFLLMTVR